MKKLMLHLDLEGDLADTLTAGQILVADLVQSGATVTSATLTELPDGISHQLGGDSLPSSVAAAGAVADQNQVNAAAGAASGSEAPVS